MDRGTGSAWTTSAGGSRDDLALRPAPLLRQADRLERERTWILPLVVADDVGQLAFRDPSGIADLRHRDWFGEAVRDGFDLGLVALDRDLVQPAGAFDRQEVITERAHRIRMVDRARRFQLGNRAGLAVLGRDLEQLGRNERRDVEIAVRSDRDAVEADAILRRRQQGIRRPDLERGATRLQAVHIGRERVGDIGGAVAADGNVVAQGFWIGEPKAALRCTAGEIEDFQPGSFGVAWAGNAKAGYVIGTDIQHAAFLVGKYTEHRTTAGGAGLDELLCFPAGRGLHHAAEVEAARIEGAVLGGCY